MRDGLLHIVGFANRSADAMASISQATSQQQAGTDQLAHAMGVSPKKLLTLIQSSQDLLSLDMTVGDSGGMTGKPQ